MIQSMVGLVAICLLAVLFSENRKKISIRLVMSALGLQLVLGLVLLKFQVIRDGFLALNHLVLILDRATADGTSMVFGYLGGGPLPFPESYPGAAFVLAFKSLPIVLVMSALSAVLFYFRIIPAVVRLFSALLGKTLKTGGAEGIGISANIFVGMVEAPLLVKPYLARMTRSELFTLMTCGMATIAGTVLVLYAGIIGPVLPGALGHILTASLISVPASILVAGVMIPETGTPTLGEITPPVDSHSSMDAVVQGTALGVRIFINVAALLVVLVALVSMVNHALGLLPQLGDAPLSMQRILGCIMSPLVWLTGIPWSETRAAGELMGTKIVLNELLAYLDLAALPTGTLSERSILIMTYAMCGFANVGSLGILIGGMSSLAPERASEIVELGPRAILAGVLATLMTGAVIGILW